MTLWWPNAFLTQPYNTWFYAKRPGETSTDPGEWPMGYYWFLKIQASGGHKDQLIFYSDVDKYYKACWSDHTKVEFHAGVKYLLCLPDDTPNWAGANLVEIAPPCGNWRSDMYIVSASTRSQTSGLLAAVRKDLELQPRLLAAVAKTDQLGDGVLAAIQANRDAPVTIRAAIMGEPSQDIGIRAAVRAERELAPGIEAAVAKTDQLGSAIKAAVQGNPQVNIRTRAAIKGEAQKTVSIVAYVVVRRVDKIKLEMENNIPQEVDIRSTPNWASKVKDWGRESFS